MKKIGVTGSNGFIGWHLCNTLLLNPIQFELIEFKRSWFDDETKLDSFVSNCDVIVHLAGINRHSDTSIIYNTNVQLANQLIASFERTGYIGTVLFSSSIQEERNNLFGNSKKEARNLFTNWANKVNAHFKGLIIPNVFGAFGVPFYNSVVATFCHQLVNNENPIVEKDVNLSLIYINDLIKNIIYLIENDSQQLISIPHTNQCNVTSILELLLYFKNTYFQDGQIPKFFNVFEVNLFNTFRSYINHNLYFPKMYKNNIDDRGNFVEIIRLETGGQVSFSTTKPGITRGNHFHTRKIERFSVIKGKALIQLRKVSTQEVIDLQLSGDDPAYVDMPIWYTHCITNIGEEELYTIFWINEFFNQDDSDTYFEKV